MHKEALTKNGFDDDYIIYTPVIENNNSERNMTRNRKMILFNPPYSMNVENNISKTFLKLVKNHFSRIVFTRYSTRTTSRLVIVA